MESINGWIGLTIILSVYWICRTIQMYIKRKYPKPYLTDEEQEILRKHEESGVTEEQSGTKQTTKSTNRREKT